MHDIIILGGNHSGVRTAHYLLRNIIPLLNSARSATEQFKVTLVSTSDHTYFNIGAPRVIASPEKTPTDSLFWSIPKGFEQYKSSEFTFIHGEAVGVNEDEKTVSVKSPGTANTMHIPYAVLVVATGTTANPLFSLNGDQTATIAAFQDIHKRLPKAKSVVIAGGGATGVEVAGEIGFFYPGIDVTLLSGTSRLLSRVTNTNVSKAAERKLAELKVKTVHNLRVTEFTKAEDGTKTALNFNDGSSRSLISILALLGVHPTLAFFLLAGSTSPPTESSPI